MMDAAYVHQRDVAKILTELQAQIEKVEAKYRGSPDSEGLANEIQSLIDATDRDLRLKTQAIVRHRLSQSRILPLKCPPPPPKARATSTLTSPLPPLPAPGSRSVLARGVDDQNVPMPIAPIHFPVKRETTGHGGSRRRKIPDLPASLPKVNWHDPSAPPPSLPPTAIATYGLQQLNESGHIRDGELKQHLSGIVTVGPYTYDMPRVAIEERTFVLDQNEDEEFEDDGAESRYSSNRDSRRTGTPVEEPVGKYVFKMVHGVCDFDEHVMVEFRRAYQNVWEPIVIVIKMLGRLCEKYGLREQYINGDVVVEVSKLEPDAVSEERLFDCMVNPPESGRRRRPARFGFGFIGPKAEYKAAVAIQCLWRGFYVRRSIRNVRRNTAAARIIQRFFKTHKTLMAFKNTLAAEANRRRLAFETSQSDVRAYDFNKAHVIVHLIDSYSPGELGRISELLNPHTTLVIFSRAPLPTYIAEFLKSHVEDQTRLKFLVPQQRLPKTLPIEDVLACDARMMRRIKETASGLPLFLLPTRPQQSEIELAMKMGGYVLGPVPSKADMYAGRGPIRRFLGAASKHLMDGSDEFFDKTAMSMALSGLAVGNLTIGQWIVKSNNGEIGWVNASDLVLLERIKEHNQVLTEKDFADESFRQLLAQNISNDIETIMNTVNGKSNKDFLRSAYINGAIIEEAPHQPKSAPSCAFFTAPGKEPKIVATWEKLYISLYEEFATIHPAFSVEREKLHGKSMKLAQSASEKQLYGYSVADYWYAVRTEFNKLDERNIKLKLTPEHIDFTKTERLLPFMLAEAMLKRHLDDSAYVYVQQVLALPAEMPIETLNEQCQSYGVPVGEKVFFVPHLQEEFIVGLVVTEKTPNRLIELVYRTLCTLSESVFNIQNDPTALLYQYCNAIEFIKNQIDEQKEIQSTVFMKKVRIKPIERPKPKEEEPLVRPAEGKRVGTSNESKRMQHRNLPAVMSATNMLDLKKERTMITTPTDKNGREKSLMVVDEDPEELP